MGGKATHVDGGSVRASTVTFSAPAGGSAAKPPHAQDRNATSVATRRLRESDTSGPIITQGGRAKQGGAAGAGSAMPGAPRGDVPLNKETGPGGPDRGGRDDCLQSPECWL